jgi:hypothetical protein
MRDFDAESVLQIRGECQDVDLEADSYHLNVSDVSRKRNKTKTAPERVKATSSAMPVRYMGILHRLGRGRVDTG